MDFHTWECISPGEYDSTYKCSRCGEIRTESIDNPDTALPARGCNESASQGGYPAWISVAERLPDVDKQVILAHWNERDGFLWIASGYYDDIDAWNCDWMDAPFVATHYRTVSHWCDMLNAPAG